MVTVFSKAVLIVSKILFSDDYTCRRYIHVALLKKINKIVPKAANRPDLEVHSRVLQKNIFKWDYLFGDESKTWLKFGWSLTSLLKKCFHVSPGDYRISPEGGKERFIFVKVQVWSVTGFRNDWKWMKMTINSLFLLFDISFIFFYWIFIF